MKKIPRVYIDTSVIGGCFDEEFARWSNALVENFRMGYFKPVVSEVVEEELKEAPDNVRRIYEQLLGYGAERLRADASCFSLMEEYRKRKILSDKFEDDMLHIALATIYNADLMVSWNFKHIVHYAKISQFNAVNIEQGYRPISIYSSREVVHEKDI